MGFDGAAFLFVFDALCGRMSLLAFGFGVPRLAGTAFRYGALPQTLLRALP